MTNGLKLQLERVERTLRKRSVNTILTRVRAIIGPAKMPPTEQGRLAQKALDNMRNLVRPTPQELAALEYVIRLMRPALLSESGTPVKADSDLAKVFPDWETFRNTSKPYLYSIGCIDSLTTGKPIGTGFLVGKDLLATNRHVLGQLSFGTNQLEKGQAAVYFGRESGVKDAQGVSDIVSVVAIHDTLDMALLGIETPATAPTRTPIAVETNPAKVGDPVVAVGYPFDDPVRNPIFIKALFGSKFGVKRAAPGEVVELGVQSLLHDCSTLGGNSGSPILSMKTARLVGLHRDGFFTYRNEAVDANSVDQFIRKHS